MPFKKLYSAGDLIRRFHLNPLADLSLLEDGLLPRNNYVSIKSHEAIVNRISASYHKAKLKQKNISLPYMPGGEWGPDIKIRRANYIKALNDNDASGLSTLLKNFFRNNGIAGLWKYAYYSDIAEGSISKKKWFINCILQDYKIWKDFVDRANLSILDAPVIGNPWGYILQGNLIMPVSFEHHYCASSVNNLLSDIESPVVAEIGGGFGGFAYFLLSTNSRIRYINFDLPEVLLIASYYLMNAFSGKRFLLFGESHDVTITQDIINSYDIILMPNFQLPNLASDSIDLFINSGSLSEMEYHTIEEYISHIVRTCKLYFFHQNSDQAVEKGYKHIEVPSSEFPIPANVFKRIYKFNLPWGGKNRYREFLYQRIKT